MVIVTNLSKNEVTKEEVAGVRYTPAKKISVHRFEGKVVLKKNK